VRASVVTQRLNLMAVTRRYAYVVLDCGPSLNLLNQNALTYADEVIIPVTCDYLALVGVKQVLKTIRTSNATSPTRCASRRCCPRSTMVARGWHARPTPPAGALRHNASIHPAQHRAGEAPANRKTIFEYAPDSNGATDYAAWSTGCSGPSRPPSWRRSRRMPTRSWSRSSASTRPRTPQVGA